jgi:hypothetical protein
MAGLSSHQMTVELFSFILQKAKAFRTDAATFPELDISFVIWKVTNK